MAIAFAFASLKIAGGKEASMRKKDCGNRYGIFPQLPDFPCFASFIIFLDHYNKDKIYYFLKFSFLRILIWSFQEISR